MSAEAAAKLAALLKRKFPGRPKANRKPPAWMPPELAAIYTQLPADTVIAPFHGRVMNPSGCKRRKELLDSVDKRGEHYAATWMPFTEDAGGGLLCFDTKTGRMIFLDAPTTGEPPKVVAPSVKAWLTATMRALAKVPDPPDPDEDDYIEEEQEDRFEEALRGALIKKAKPAAKPKPRADVPPPPPPPDEDFPKEIQFFATYKETKKHAFTRLYVGHGVGTVLGKTKLRSVGMPGYGGHWPKGMQKLVFHHGQQAGIALLDEKSHDAFLTFDDTKEAAVFVKDVDRILKGLGLLIDVIDDPAAQKRAVKRWLKYVDG